jgi:hypothetical protein
MKVKGQCPYDDGQAAMAIVQKILAAGVIRMVTSSTSYQQICRLAGDLYSAYHYSLSQKAT